MSIYSTDCCEIGLVILNSSGRHFFCKKIITVDIPFLLITNLCQNKVDLTVVCCLTVYQILCEA